VEADQVIKHFKKKKKKRKWSPTEKKNDLGPTEKKKNTPPSFSSSSPADDPSEILPASNSVHLIDIPGPSFFSNSERCCPNSRLLESYGPLQSTGEITKSAYFLHPVVLPPSYRSTGGSASCTETQFATDPSYLESYSQTHFNQYTNPGHINTAAFNFRSML
jgi:hypothetical protein